MSKGFWIGVAHRRQALAARAAGFCAFSHGKREAAERVGTGDGVLYYAPKSDFDGDPVQAFVALAWITGETAEEREMPGTEFRPWTRAARFEDVEETLVRPDLELLPALLVDVRTPQHRVPADARRQGDRPSDLGPRTASDVHDLGCRLIEQLVIVGLEPDANLLTGRHFDRPAQSVLRAARRLSAAPNES